MKRILIASFLIVFFFQNLMAQVMGVRSQTRVLVVGISDYQDEQITDLKFAHRDADAFAAFMTSKAGGELSADNIRILKNNDATTAQIYSAMDWLLDESQKKDKVIIYFSGHGDVETKTIRQRGYLLAHDTPANNYRVGAVRLEDLNDILATLSQVNEAQIILITDACHSGNLAGSGIDGTQATATALTAQFANEVKIMSCQPNELSLEGTQWGDGRGLFSYHLIEGLVGFADKNNDGQVNLREIERYLEDKVSEEAAPQSQIPMTIGDKNARISLVDEASLEALTNEKTSLKPEMTIVASRNTNIASLVEIDSTILNLHTQFVAALTEKYFLPSDINDSRQAGKSASELYETLSQEDALQPIQNILKRDFAAALQDVAQQDIVAYLNADPEEMNERWKNHGERYLSNPDYLAKAIDLLGENHYMYEQLLAKQYYFEGLLSRLEAEQTSDKELFDKAFEKVQLALKYDDQAAYVYNELGLIKQFGDRDFKSAKLYFDTASMIAPTWVLPYNNLCRIYKILHQYEKAESFGKKAIELKADYYQAYLNLALVYEGKKDFINAEKMYQKAIELNPNYTKALNNLGTMYLEKDDFDASLPLLQRAVESDSTYLLAQSNLALNYLLIQDYSKAVVHYNKAHQLDPNEKEISDNLGYAFYKIGDYDSAEIYFQKALEIDSTYERAYKDLNQLFYKTKNWKAAEENLLKWLQINPGKAVNYYNLACIKSINGEIEKGLEYLEESFKKGYQDLNNIKKDPDIKNLRSTTAYASLLEKYFPG